MVGARAELDLDLAHYWVMFHRRDNGLEQFRIDLLRVDDTQMPIKSLKVQVGDNLIDLSHCPDMLDESTWTAWVDQRSDSVHLTIPREIELDSITVLTSQIRAAGLSGLLRPRMSTDALADQPFMRLARVAEQLRAVWVDVPEGLL